jgi:dTDP-4-dehydrorhamnose reductase
MAAEDLVISPTYVPDLAEAVLDLLIDGETGLWHLANGGAVSWAEFGRLIAVALGHPPRAVRGAPWGQFGWAAQRPARVPLASERGQVMPSLEDALRRYGQAARETRSAGGRATRIALGMAHG